jgi:hypothetical protein
MSISGQVSEYIDPKPGREYMHMESHAIYPNAHITSMRPKNTDRCNRETPKGAWTFGVLSVTSI